MGRRDEIRTALLAQLATVSGFPPNTRWSVENDAFQPTPGLSWAQIMLVPNLHRRVTSPGQNAWVENGGLWLVDVFLPLGTGTTTGDALASAFEDRFPGGQQFTIASGILRVTRSLMRGGRRAGVWYHLPGEVAYELFTTQVLV